MTLEKAYRGNHQANASGDKANKPHKVLIMALVKENRDRPRFLARLSSS
ncbi:hypothetical protein Thiowin_01061 [Thiorhodovibrio winogradskyi]|uniref:Transposase n=1 Tax=Thiorhodovibrio winogradskyi TaxID=77007 RepID=A0ABZ0S6B0_9GAMM